MIDALTMLALAAAVGTIVFLCAKDAYRRLHLTKAQRRKEDAEPLDEAW